jgi:thiol-disulfide isomerase/thioredoxin
MHRWTIALGLTLALAFSAFGADIWERDFDKALERAKADNKLIVMDIYADWCAPCKMMDANTFSDPKVQQRLGDFVPVKIDGDNEPMLARRYGTQSYPTISIVLPDGSPLLREASYKDVDMFMDLLTRAEARRAEVDGMEKQAAAEPENIAVARQLVGLYLEARANDRALAHLQRIEPAVLISTDQELRADFFFKYGFANLVTDRILAGQANLTRFREEFPEHPMHGRAGSLIDQGTLFLAMQKVEDSEYDEARRLLTELKESPIDPRAGAQAGQFLERIGLLGRPAPALDVSEWVAGTAQSLDKLKGKVVLLDVFQIICPGCEAAHPQIVQLAKDYRDSGLEVVGLAVAFELQDSQQPEAIRKYVSDKEFPYPVAIDRDLTTTFEEYDAGGTPWTVLIDRQGTVRYASVFNQGQVERLVKQLLAEPA